MLALLVRNIFAEVVPESFRLTDGHLQVFTPKKFEIGKNLQKNCKCVCVYGWCEKIALFVLFGQLISCCCCSVWFC